MPEHYIAIDNICGWPNLTVLQDGSLIATVFNQPCHGHWEGDVDCYASTDGGRIWQYRGTPALHEPEQNRMNVAAGRAINGDLIVLASGWDRRPAKGEPMDPDHRIHIDDCLRAWICRSSDGGRTWAVDHDSFPKRQSAQHFHHIPFGDIMPGADGILGACIYCTKLDEATGRYTDSNSYFAISRDDGHTWDDPIQIGNGDQNEATPLHLGDGQWLVAARAANDGHLELYRSIDNGRSWAFEQPLSLPSQHPAQLTRLHDGSILLTYGVRCRDHFGVYLRRSTDMGRTWSAPIQRKGYPAVDSGYPSTAQLDDGSLVTAYYCGSQPHHQRYHVGVVVWQFDELYK